MIDHQLDYLHNPVEAGIDLSSAHYLYSRATNYAVSPKR